MKRLLPLILISISLNSSACSMFKITKDGKTLVGNNEDYYNPITRVWFQTGEEGQFGVVNFGFSSNFAQGAMNDAGLVFDGFSMQYLAVNDTAGKLLIPNAEYIPHIMHNFSTVHQVKAYMATINLSHLSNSMYLFVDRSGEYLIVEGDSLILGNDAAFTLSNFYPSQIANIDEVPIPFYQTGRSFIEQNEARSDFNYCSQVMSNLQQEITQYSSIYDLNTGKIKLHHFHDFENYVELDLTSELAKGNHEFIIPELFSKDSEGYIYYEAYSKHPEQITERIGNKWKMAQSKFDEPTLTSIATEIESLLNSFGYEWLRRGQLDGAIHIFKYNTELFPKASNAFDSLGEAYLTNKEYKLAIKNYKKAVKLNTQNEVTRKASQLMLKKAKMLKKGK